MEQTDLSKVPFKPQVLRLIIPTIMLLSATTVAWISSPLAAAGTVVVHAGLAATEAVKTTVAELIQVLDDPRLKEPQWAEQRRHEIERVVKRRVSYEEMAKRALGASWSELNEQDRQEFVGLFVQLLRDAFAGRINEHSDEELVPLGEQRDDQFAEVRTQLKGHKVDTRVDFRLMHASGDWLVYDVVIDGASIVSNYRAQFASIIRDVTYGGLVKKMKQRAVAVKFFENTTPR